MHSWWLKADKSKIEAIVKMCPPKNETDLKSFLGMVNYLGWYTPSLAELRPPLDRLYKKDTVWRWDPEHQRAFEGIKSAINSLPVLAYFDAKSEHTIQCDVSKQGLGTILLQEGKPVMYISRTLIETEQRYSNIEHELLAVRICTWETKPLHCRIQSESRDWSRAPDEHMEEVNCKHKYQSSETTTQTTSVWHRHSVPTRQEKCNCRCTL